MIVIVIESNRTDPKVHGYFENEIDAEKFLLEKIAKNWSEKNWLDVTVSYVEVVVNNKIKVWNHLQQEYI